MGVAGFYLTLVFDLLTNLGAAISFYNGDYAIALILGLYFMAVHVVSNTIMFATIGPVVSRRVVNLIGS
jgi:phage-related holin